MIEVVVVSQSIDVGSLTDRLAAGGVGAVASFVGIVRGDDGLASLTLDHYPGMTEDALRKLAIEAAARWSLKAAIIAHRVGTMIPGDRIVFVGTASPHRADALEACAFLIDRLKTDAPFWKREAFADGREKWVEARDTDAAAAARWRY